MTTICGADGCKRGWVTITKELVSGRITWRLFTSASELFQTAPLPHVIGLDIPIGLPDRGPRACDMEARQLLGPGRASSVYPAPIRAVLAASDYREACQIRLEAERKKLSRQAWGIVAKVREVNEALRQNPGLLPVVHEVHPELSFFHLAGGRPMKHSKRAAEGKAERFKLLEPVFGGRVQAALADRKALGSSEDDILDAFAVLWTAGRIASGAAKTLPALPPQDGFGIPMRIVA